MTFSNSSHVVRPCFCSCVIWQTSAKQLAGQEEAERGGQLRSFEIHSSVSNRSLNISLSGPRIRGRVDLRVGPRCKKIHLFTQQPLAPLSSSRATPWR